MNSQSLTLDQALAIAVRHHSAGDLPSAEAIYKQILQANPNHPVAWHNLGELSCRLHNFNFALECLSRAVALQPNDANTQNTYSVALLGAGKSDESYIAVKRVLELNPNLSSGWSNLGMCLADRGDLPGSVAAFEKAIAIDPNNACAHDGLGLSLLMSGHLQRGWQEQEWRWKKHDFAPSRFPNVPHWKGEYLNGKTLFIYIEQGYGDVIQLCRYVPLLVQRGARVLLESADELAGLLKNVIGTDGRAALVPVGQTPPHFDFACPLMSIPLWYGTELDTIPANIPYLRPDPKLVEAWRPYFQTDPAFKVGLAWAGRPTHANDLNRSTTLSSFFPLAQIPGLSFYSLQKGPAAAQTSAAEPRMRIVDLSPRLDNFDVTAAIISQLDLVIAVDTVVIHLAGAMGKPVWPILAFCPDWRWMLNRSDTPWYPTMRLFRLPRRGDWPAVIENVKNALAHVSRKP